MGSFYSEESPPKQTITVVNNSSTTPQQTQIINKNNNSYELSLVLLSLWGIPTMICCCIYSYRKYGHGSIIGFLFGFLFTLSLK